MEGNENTWSRVQEEEMRPRAQLEQGQSGDWGIQEGKHSGPVLQNEKSK